MKAPEEQARIKAIRERFQAERPSMDELIASGEYEGPVTLGEALDALAAKAKGGTLRGTLPHNDPPQTA